MPTMRAKQRILWACTVLFGTVSLFGQGLHLLPGLGHSCAPEPNGTMVCRPSGHDGCSHAGRVATGRTQALACCAAPGDCGDGVAAHRRAGHDAASCPICQFFATPKAAVALLEFTPGVGICHGIRGFPEPLRFERAFLHYDSRGPPAAPPLLHG